MRHRGVAGGWLGAPAGMGMIMAEYLRPASARSPVCRDQHGRVQLETSGRIVGNIIRHSRLDNPLPHAQQKAANFRIRHGCRLRQNLLQHIP